MLTIEDWCIVPFHHDPYTAPEMTRVQLYGKVFDHESPLLNDGLYCTTSYIIGKKGRKVVTFSRSEYTLGEVNVEYEKEFEDAEHRLLQTLKEIVEPKEK